MEWIKLYTNTFHLVGVVCCFFYLHGIVGICICIHNVFFSISRHINEIDNAPHVPFHVECKCTSKPHRQREGKMTGMRLNEETMWKREKVRVQECTIEKKNAHPIRTTFTMQFSYHISLQSANQNVWQCHNGTKWKTRKNTSIFRPLFNITELLTKYSESASVRAWQANERKRRVWRTIRFTSYYLQKESFRFSMFVWFRQGIFQTISRHM